jgi:hypothetical protein
MLKSARIRMAPIVAPTPIPAFAPVLRPLFSVACVALVDEVKVCEGGVGEILVEDVTEDDKRELDVLGMVEIMVWEDDVGGMLEDEIGDEIDVIEDVERELDVLGITKLVEGAVEGEFVKPEEATGAIENWTE